MALTTSNITGRIPLPNNSVAGSVEVVFTLNTYDTEGLDTIPPQSTVSFVLNANGEFPAGSKVWRNVRGLRGTSYAVTVRWSEMVAGKPVTKVGALGHVQVGDAESYSLADLIAAPASGDIGWYVNVPQATWTDINERIDYMYSIAESSLPATVERAVEAELAAKASEQAAAQSAQAAAGSADQAVIDVNAARDGALAAIGTAETNSVDAVETARDDAIALIDPKVQTATTAAQTATTKAGEAAGSATAAGGSATAAGQSASAAAGSATAADGSAQAAAGSADAANTSAVSALASKGLAEQSASVAQTAEGNALASEIAARSSETAAALSAGAAASSAGAAESARSAALSSASAAALSSGSANDAYVATQDLMDTFANFRFLGKVEWWAGALAFIPVGFLPLNGQILNRADYPDLWEDIENGVFVSVTDTLWLNGPNAESKHRHRASFSTGDGTTTFRMPDLNGVQSDSLKGLFLRGSQNGDGLSQGQVFRDAIRNITGGFTSIVPNNHSSYANGAFGASNGIGSGSASYPVAAGAYTDPTRYGFGFDASRVVPTANENRPVSAVGTWIMLVNGAPARQFNPETSAGLGSNTFGGLQKFNAGFEFTGVVPQLIQTDVDQGLTVAQKLMASKNAGALSYSAAQGLTSAERVIAASNMGALSFMDSQTLTVAQKIRALGNLGIVTYKGSAGWVCVEGVYFLWNRVAVPSGGYGGVTLPLTFPNAFRQVLASPAEDVGGGYVYVVTARVINISTIYVVGHTITAGGLVLSSPAFTYLAIGD